MSSASIRQCPAVLSNRARCAGGTSLPAMLPQSMAFALRRFANCHGCPPRPDAPRSMMGFPTAQLNSARLWIAWASPSHDRAAPSGGGASVNISYKAPPTVWVAPGWVWFPFPHFGAVPLKFAVARPGLAGTRAGQDGFSPLTRQRCGRVARTGCGRTRPTPLPFGLPLACPCPACHRYRGHGTTAAPCFSTQRAPDADPIFLGRDTVRFPRKKQTYYAQPKQAS
jgi:hypothetical protein